MPKPSAFLVSTATLLALALLVGAPPAPQARPLPAEPQEVRSGESVPVRIDTGWRDYQRYCQTCHGKWGAGDGSVAKWLKIPPTDLTQLSENNDGVFPADRVARMIDGREEVRLHGSRDMPIWGELFHEAALQDETEPAVEDRVTALTETVRWLDSRQAEMQRER